MEQDDKKIKRLAKLARDKQEEDKKKLAAKLKRKNQQPFRGGTSKTANSPHSGWGDSTNYDEDIVSTR